MKIELNPVKRGKKIASAIAPPVGASYAPWPPPPAKPLYDEDGYLDHTVSAKLFGATSARKLALFGVHPSLVQNFSTSAKAVESTMANEFVTILQKIGSIFEKGLSEAVKYLPLASTLAGFLFPPAVAPLAAATTVADLLQNAVAEVEQKLAAQGNQNGTGAQKLATVLTIVTSSVTGLLADPTVAAELKKAGITVNTAYITNLVNAVVSFLNVQGVVTTTVAA